MCTTSHHTHPPHHAPHHTTHPTSPHITLHAHHTLPHHTPHTTHTRTPHHTLPHYTPHTTHHTTPITNGCKPGISETSTFIVVFSNIYWRDFDLEQLSIAFLAAWPAYQDLKAKTYAIRRLADHLPCRRSGGVRNGLPWYRQVLLAIIDDKKTIINCSQYNSGLSCNATIVSSYVCACINRTFLCNCTTL